MLQQIYMDVPSKRAPGLTRVRASPKVEYRWGYQYQIAVQYATLRKQRFPYMPTEPPASLSEEIIESGPLYVCKQCKDCFRFQSSFEDHCKRRSWILGLWCHNCFRTVCYHILESKTTCTICVAKDCRKRAYLRARGFTKQSSKKLGAIKVFYNQCQLFEHMKLHNIRSLDMSDVMLMPLPTNLIDSDWSSELEIACEAIMEHTFLSRVHIMDWLKKNNVEHNWWKLANNSDESDKNPISRVVKGYQGRQLFTAEKLIGTQNSSSSDTIHNVNKSSLDIEFIDTNFKDKEKNTLPVNVNADKNVSENEDNPCMSSDIAFVDCGPVSNFFEPEPSVSYVSNKHMTIFNNDSGQDILNWPLTDVANNKRANSKRKNVAYKDISLIGTNKIHENTITAKGSERNLSESADNKQFVKDCTQLYKTDQPSVMKTAGNSISKPIIDTNVAKNLNNPTKINVPAKKIKLCKTNSNHLERNLQASIENCSSKIVTVQSSKNTDITSIINNLPAHLLSNNKKIILLEQDSKGFVTFKNDLTIAKETNKAALNNIDVDINISSQKKQIAGKILVKNGKKYFIKHLENTKNSENSSNLSIVTNASKDLKLLTTEHNTPTSTSSGEIEIIDTVQTTSPHNEIPLLTPSPSPSELSSSESHSKQENLTKLQMILPKLVSPNTIQKNEVISLVQEENGELYMKATLDCIPKRFHDMCEEIPKCRQKMIDEFYHLNGSELKKRIDHLQNVSEEVANVLHFISNDVRKEKFRFISGIQRVLHECFNKRNREIQQSDKDLDVMLDEWELNKAELQRRCPSCRKTLKPKSYVAAFSKLPKDDNTYCRCYKYVCHECSSYHGPLARFIAHQNFHKKKEPYVCPECRCVFTSAKLLEVHTWTVCFHSLKKHVFACKICEIDGFRDIESITKHFVIMHCVVKIVCEVCFRVFSSYGEYVKHNKEQHSFGSEQNPIRLVICKPDNEIVRFENFMSYLEKYPAIRKLIWFKCPFCPMITRENKHITAILNAHLRDKHLHRLLEVISKEALANILKTSTSKSITNTFANATRDDGIMVPKIVNTRTISSEIFERGSQDTDDTWSINSDSSAPTMFPHDVSLHITKDVDDTKEQLDSLPKILNVRSMVDLKATASNITTTSILSVTSDDKRTSQISQFEAADKEKSSEIIIKHEEVDIPCEGAKDAMLKLDDSKSDCIKEMKQVVETDKSDNESMTLSTFKFEGFSEKIASALAESSTETSTYISTSPSELRTDADNHTKEVDVTSKPNIEALIVVNSCKVDAENSDRMSFVSKPPPLARIPQHLLPSEKTTGSLNRSRNVAKSKFLIRKLNRKPKCRIAIGGPTDMQEERVEFLCHLCKDKIDTSWPVIQAHFSKKHSYNYKLAVLALHLTRLSFNFINCYKQVISSKKRKSDNVLSTPKRKRRWTPKKYTDVRATDVGFCVQEETAEDGEGNIKCKKCDQRCTDISNLREHIIANHRLKGRYLICLECGENFVVEPSLQMHLKAFHGIENPIDYMNQNPSYAPDVNSDVETEGRTTVANQCYVCMAVFEDKAAVDKHLRVHGMAFLNRKRIEARNAQKSSEEKAKVEEDKQSPVKESSKEAVKRDKPVETILEKINAAI